jgi:hypothetical protein
MNDLIKKLAKQATEYATTRHPLSNITLSVNSDLFEQKFAELIVRECLKIVEPDMTSGDEWCVTLKGAAQEIKEHFGVEE